MVKNKMLFNQVLTTLTYLKVTSYLITRFYYIIAQTVYFAPGNDKNRFEMVYTVNDSHLKLNFMSKERCFLEYVRTYINYDNEFFINNFKLLDINNLEKVLKKYPLQNVVKKINQIKKCI